MAGFRSVWAVDFDRASCETYALNFGHTVFCGDIREAKPPFPEADVVIGGPPCQGFSPLGQMSPSDEHVRMNELWREFLRILRVVRPSAFVVENVPQFLGSKQAQLFLSTVARLGYGALPIVLNAYEFGVPQKRRRGFILGSIIGPPMPPTPNGIRRTVRDAIGDLPIEPTNLDLHFGRSPRPNSLERYKCIPPGGNRFDLIRKRPDLAPACWLKKKSGSTDVFGRLRWDRPSLTIRTEFYKPEKGCYLHPESHRPITHREAARLQSFPDSFQFLGSKIEIARMIGNAVPPLLAKAVALSIRPYVVPRQRTPQESRMMAESK